MSRVFRALAVGIVCFSLVGCYHATIETGKAPGNQVVENNWAHGFLYGLVPPSTVNVQDECSSGVARVETVHSFLNQVASTITWGLYTPMTIRVTCASSGNMDADAAVVDSREEAKEALERGETFYVPLE